MDFATEYGAILGSNHHHKFVLLTTIKKQIYIYGSILLFIYFLFKIKSKVY